MARTRMRTAIFSKGADRPAHRYRYRLSISGDFRLNMNRRLEVARFANSVSRLPHGQPDDECVLLNV